MCTARSCTCPNGIDQCLNGGTFNNATCTCSCPSGFTDTVCETISTLTCKNSGTFNNVTKTCSCFPNYSGALCQNLNCLLPDPAICVSFLTADCNITTLGNYCPNKCGRCLPTTSSLTTNTTPETTTQVNCALLPADTNAICSLPDVTCDADLNFCPKLCCND